MQNLWRLIFQLVRGVQEGDVSAIEPIVACFYSPESRDPRGIGRLEAAGKDLADLEGAAIWGLAGLAPGQAELATCIAAIKRVAGSDHAIHVARCNSSTSTMRTHALDRARRFLP